MKSPTFTAALPLLRCPNQAAWSAWLDRNHAQSPGVWLILAKATSSDPTVTYPQAVESALCHGWIDGQKKTHDQDSWLQKFTRRGKKSIWSKINREKVLVLIERNEMRPAGLVEVERAQKDGRWEAAYDPPSRSTVPDDFQAALDASPEAKGQSVLGHAEVGESVCGPLPDPDGEAGGYAGAADHGVHRHAGAGREAASLSRARTHPTSPGGRNR